MRTVCFSGFSLLLGLYTTVCDNSTGALRIPLRLPISVEITDAGSNTLKLANVAVDQTSIQVLDKNGVQLCAWVNVARLGLAAERNAHLIAHGMSPDLLAAIDDAMEKVGPRIHYGAPLLPKITQIAKLVTVGEPLMVKPGDIPNICKPISTAL